VLLGQMSLVGPRPALPEEVARYDNHAHRRLAVQPGMTGLWQISGRSDLSWEDSIRLDLRYVETWSLTLDLHILCKTWPAVIHGKGAYLACRLPRQQCLACAFPCASHPWLGAAFRQTLKDQGS
jgi:lipopolysaccharide/colanic/teichoic acid biosynthesis glycosyltransferase